MLFRSMEDGEALDTAFEAYWPAYREWMAKPKKRTSAKRAREALAEYMPELVPTLEQLLARFGDRAEVARFLTLYNPPPLVRGCTQAIWLGDGGPAMVRNYDHAPHLADGVVLHADWGGVKTLCVTDCLWGALDGVNEHGLCVALAFGGRPTRGDGFAAPLLVRYALQTCTTANEAAEAIARVPCAMTYTFVCLDEHGDHATVYAAPDRPARIDHQLASANHQGKVEWPQYALKCKTVERLAHTRKLLDARSQSLAGLTKRFLEAPLYRATYDEGSGTLYTCVYSPADRSLALHWRSARPVSPMACDLHRYEAASTIAYLG
ncbi:MAG: C45 family autoproteolytic acyltransferase/hydrolase [Phycisphaerales bacterium]